MQQHSERCHVLRLHISTYIGYPSPGFFLFSWHPLPPSSNTPFFPLGKRKIPLFLFYVLFSFSRSPLCSPQFYLRKDGGESYTTCVGGHWSLRQKQQSWRWDGEEGSRAGVQKWGSVGMCRFEDEWAEGRGKGGSRKKR